MPHLIEANHIFTAIHLNTRMALILQFNFTPSICWTDQDNLGVQADCKCRIVTWSNKGQSILDASPHLLIITYLIYLQRDHWEIKHSAHIQLAI